MVPLSYDVAGASRPLSVRVAHLIFGRSDAKPATFVPYVARPGVVWIGQSVLLMPTSLAHDLANRLRDLGASVTIALVAISVDELEAFRRRGRPKPRRVNKLTEA
jgi:hypothetical protein